jgi:hypothetical protein
MRRISPLPLALLGLAVSSGAAAAHPSTGHVANTRQDRAALRRERVAVHLINEAARHVRQTHPACRLPRHFDPRPTFTDERPSDALLSTLGVLRRPATEADHVDRRSLEPTFASGIFENWTRVATAADGRQFVVVIAQDRLRMPLPPHRCVDLEDAELRRLLSDRTPAVRRVALRLKARLNREEHPKSGFTPTEAIFLFDRTPDGSIGGGGGGVDLRWFLRHGLFGSAGVGNRSTVSGLVPDGVASIDVTFPRTVSRGPHRDSKVFPTAIRLTVPVRDNVVAFDVDRTAPDVVGMQMVWRRADGSVMRRVG